MKKQTEKIKVVEGNGAVLGRLASYVAKEALKGETLAVVNCDEVIISGNQKMNRENYESRRRRTGGGFKGPKHPKPCYMIVKRTIRGMVPQYRYGRGREAFKRVKCYDKVPAELESMERIKIEANKPLKHSKIKEFSK